MSTSVPPGTFATARPARRREQSVVLSWSPAAQVLDPEARDLEARARWHDERDRAGAVLRPRDVLRAALVRRRVGLVDEAEPAADERDLEVLTLAGGQRARAGT